MQVWKLTWLRSVVKIWSEPSFIDLLCHVAAEGEVREIGLFAGIAWWIWRHRNNAFHWGKELQASELFHKAVEWMEEWSNANVKDQKPLQSSDNDADSLIWESPPPSWMKLHFDGACDVKKMEELVYVRAVVLDEFGRMQGALVDPVDGTLSLLATEAGALRYGILYCKELGFTRVEIEGDVLNVLKALDSNGFDHLSEIGAVIEGVKHVMVEMEMVKWKHVRKKYNQLPHALARPVSFGYGWEYVLQGNRPYLDTRSRGEIYYVTSLGAEASMRCYYPFCLWHQ